MIRVPRRSSMVQDHICRLRKRGNHNLLGQVTPATSESWMRLRELAHRLPDLPHAASKFCLKPVLNIDASQRYDTATSSPRLRGGRPAKALNLRTLDPTRLCPEDFVCLAGRTTITTRILANPLPKPLRQHYIGYFRRSRSLPFPPQTQGFLYWYKEPDAPILASEVRFRITGSPEVGQFSSGQDLRLPEGKVWHISLFDISRYTNFLTLRTVLLNDGLINQELLDRAAKVMVLQGSRVMRPASDSQFIWKFGQPFMLHFGMKNQFWILGSSDCQWSSIMNMYAKAKGEPAFTGRYLAQFEPSAFPQHRGTRTVVLRIVRILELGKTGGAPPKMPIPLPREGDFAYARTRGSNAVRQEWVPWSVDVDKVETPARRALKILFENEARLLQNNPKTSSRPPENQSPSHLE